MAEMKQEVWQEAERSLREEIEKQFLEDAKQKMEEVNISYCTIFN